MPGDEESFGEPVESNGLDRVLRAGRDVATGNVPGQRWAELTLVHLDSGDIDPASPLAGRRLQTSGVT